jgi:hypothetical protein
MRYFGNNFITFVISSSKYQSWSLFLTFETEAYFFNSCVLINGAVRGSKRMLVGPLDHLRWKKYISLKRREKLIRRLSFSSPLTWVLSNATVRCKLLAAAHIACILFCFPSTVPVLLHKLHVSCFASHRLSLSCCTHCMYPILLPINCTCPAAHMLCIMFCFPSTVPVLLHTFYVSCFAFHRLSLSLLRSSLFTCLFSRCVIIWYVPFISRNISASACRP